MSQEKLTEKEKYYLACLALNKHAFNIWQGYAPVIYNKDVENVLKEAFGVENFSIFNTTDIEVTKSNIKKNPTTSVKLEDIFSENMQQKLKELVLMEINKKLKFFNKAWHIDSYEYIDRIAFCSRKIKFLPGTFSAGKYFYTSLLIFKNCTFDSIQMKEVIFKNNNRKKGKKTKNKKLIFKNCKFQNDFKINKCIFELPTTFTRSIFENGISIVDSTFKEMAGFSNITSNGNESKFEIVLFYKTPRFDNATFNNKENITFKYSLFHDVSFGNVVFNGNVYFRSASFIGEANFHDSRFNGKAIFDIAKKTKHKRYLSAYARGNNFTIIDDRAISEVENHTFSHINSNEGEMTFFGCYFSQELSFDRRILESLVSFESTTFKSIPRFYNIENIEFLDFSNCTFSYISDLNRIYMEKSETVKKNITVQIITNIRNLQRIAENTKNRELYTKLFLTELDIKNKFSKNTNLIERTKNLGLKLLYSLYQIFSAGGQSIFRPIFTLIIIFNIFFCLYGYQLDEKQIINNCPHASYTQNGSITLKLFPKKMDLVYYTTANLIPIGVSKGKLKEVSDSLSFKKDSKIYIYFLNMIEQILGSLLLFLTLFAFRNYFKMK